MAPTILNVFKLGGFWMWQYKCKMSQSKQNLTIEA